MPEHSYPLAKAQRLLGDIRSLVETARQRTAQAANAGLVALYWSVGERLRREILSMGRSGYGEKIVSTMARQLAAEYGGGFSRANLFNMLRFSEVFPRAQIVQTLSRQLGWSHFLQLLRMDNDIQRDFYAEMCRVERWSVRTLKAKIAGMLYERTALSRKPAELAALELKNLREDDKMTPDMVFQDPHILDFLKLKGAYQEKDFEAAILREMEAFILELGAGFSFIARQKRIQLGDTDYYLDLLFFHRKLRRLVAIELKLDRFRPEFKGQMELYLRWLEKYDRQPGEEPPIGLILCAGKGHGEIELLQLDKSGIHVAEYMTELPPRAMLEKKLREALASARRGCPENAH